jgi:acetyl-CoA acetyltransferase
MRRDLGFDFCRNPSEKNPFVAGPLKRSDCSLVSDGAAALVLSNEPLAGAKVPAVRWRSRTHVNEFLPLSRRDATRFEGAALAWQKGLADAGASLDDLKFVEPTTVSRSPKCLNTRQWAWPLTAKALVSFWMASRQNKANSPSTPQAV